MCVKDAQRENRKRHKEIEKQINREMENKRASETDCVCWFCVCQAAWLGQGSTGSDYGFGLKQMDRQGDWVLIL